MTDQQSMIVQKYIMIEQDYVVAMNLIGILKSPNRVAKETCACPIMVGMVFGMIRGHPQNMTT